MCGCGGDLGALRSIGTAGECPPPAPTHELPADELCAQCWAGTVTSMGPQCLLPPLLLCSVLVGGGGAGHPQDCMGCGGGVWCWGCHGMRDAVVPTGMAMDVGCCGVWGCGVGLRYPILSIWCGVPGGGKGMRGLCCWGCCVSCCGMQGLWCCRMLCPPALCCSAPHPQRPSLPHVSPPRLTARGLLGLQHRVPPPAAPPIPAAPGPAARR